MNFTDKDRSSTLWSPQLCNFFVDGLPNSDDDKDYADDEDDDDDDNDGKLQNFAFTLLSCR